METFSIVNDFLSLILFQNLCLNRKFPPESFPNAIIFPTHSFISVTSRKSIKASKKEIK